MNYDHNHDWLEMLKIDTAGIPARALFSVVAQHASSAWSEQCLEFTAYLFLILLFPSTLIPASIFGLSMTLGSLLLSSRIGSIVDRSPRLSLARRAILLQKICQVAIYTTFMGIFHFHSGKPGEDLFERRLSPVAMLKARQDIQQDTAGNAPALTVGDFGQLLFLALVATVGRLATTCIDLAVDRDWVLVVSEGKPDQLTLFNTFNRRAFLTCKLVAPMFVSAITSSIGYRWCAIVLLAISLITAVSEVLWVGVIWKAFPVLQELEVTRSTGGTGTAAYSHEMYTDSAAPTLTDEQTASGSWRDWVEFARMPVFLSSLAVSTLYLTTLSFDGIMLSWLKTDRAFSDIFISAMRGICVITGLAGTVVMPAMEKRLGLVRAGAWSIWFEIACLIPVVFCLYFDSASRSVPILYNAIFFLFLALSRTGLYAFDLVQLQEMQTTLENHPRRNTYMAIQISMQSAFDLAKYALVMVLNRPKDFRWTALVSLLTVAFGGILYSIYLRRIRGHLLHWNFKGHGKAFRSGSDANFASDDMAAPLIYKAVPVPSSEHADEFD